MIHFVPGGGGGGGQDSMLLMPHSHQSLNTFNSCLVKHGLKLFSS